MPNSSPTVVHLAAARKARLLREGLQRRLDDMLREVEDSPSSDDRVGLLVEVERSLRLLEIVVAEMGDDDLASVLGNARLRLIRGRWGFEAEQQAARS